MQKKLLTIAILSLLFSCKKDDVPTPESKETKTSTAKRTPIETTTLQTVVVHNTVWISFGWEYVINGDHGPLTAYTSSIKSGMITGGSNVSWTQGQVFWSNLPSNPNVINVLIKGSYVHLEQSQWGVDKIEDQIEINISYDVKSHVKIITVKSTGSEFVTK